MKTLKKALALMLALTVVFAYTAVGAFAAGDLTVDAKVTVTGFEEGDTVAAYQFITWVDGDGWKLANGITGITLDEKSINPFYGIKYYCKNYHGSGKNRLVEIYYYIVYCDSKYDDSKKQLDANEIIQNYECRYISICDLKNILIENKKTTKENNSALDDMIIILDEFLKIYKG